MFLTLRSLIDWRIQCNFPTVTNEDSNIRLLDSLLKERIAATGDERASACFIFSLSSTATN